MNIITKHDPYTGTPFDGLVHERQRKSIFVSIISYRDDSVIDTIHSLFNNAKRPENIFISVAVSERMARRESWIDELEIISKKFKDNLTLSMTNCNKNTSIGQLRKKADEAYNKQDYYLSINSRTEFDPYWDDILIKQYIDTKNIFLDTDILITADPRKYLPHEEIVKGFVYFTNHKTKKSMQREEYDGCRIPISGFTEFVTENNIDLDMSASNYNEEYNFYFEKNQSKINEEYLQNNGFIKFSSRKFIKNEYIAISLGLSSKFIFTEAKKYLKINPSKKELIDNEQFEFYSFINLIKNNFLILSLRFIPIYYLYDDGSSFVKIEQSPSLYYSEEEYKNSDGVLLIDKLITQNVYKNNHFDSLLSVDWENKKFKPRKNILKNKIIDSINSFISLYNFSTYENSLHWNKKC